VLGGEAGKGRPDDLIGLVVFGTYADGACPLTLNHGNLLNILDQVEVARERSESATAIGEELGLAVERLLDSTADSRVVILLTDGVNNAGEIDPLRAAELAASHGIMGVHHRRRNQRLRPLSRDRLPFNWHLIRRPPRMLSCAPHKGHTMSVCLCACR
jgi:hypothetical protein